MDAINKELIIAKEAAAIKLNDSTGTMTIEAAIKQAQRNFNKVNGWHEIIKAVIDKND